MKKIVVFFLLILAGFMPVVAQEDVEGSKDPALFTRMPGFYIYRYDDLQFDKYEFPVSSEKTQAVEGHSIFIIYWLKDNVQQPSALQIIRNYSNAMKKIGGQLIYEYEDGGSQNIVLKLVKDKKETWAYVYAAGNTYNINIIEKEAMGQDVVADASSMASSIKETGKVAVYGIYFDTGKSTLKPESQPTLQEIAKLLKNDLSLKLFVVGHTDNTGTFDANIKLSLDRATTVVNALVSQYQVNSASLKACGDGPTAPVASNGTEEGKALNRRVELVKQ
ncbi:MAG: OmpA family protein [Bacteroidia bacterium]|nr:OmpA family protein [Bacteroidia bacterium]